MKQGQFPEIIKLGDLNGRNGFKLDGENNNDQSGWFVSAAGDVNNDGHADLLIGAQHHNNDAGRSYVMFGGPGVGSSGLLFLANLNGTNGFKIDGEVSGEISGNVVRLAGDINTDGYADLFIGAPYYNARTGRSYIVFGGPGVGNSGLLSLANLNGTNGFKIDGEAANDDSGASADSGDVNGDGHSDLLIGAPYHNNTGRSYVVFGGPGVESSGLLALSSLNGVNGFKIDGEAISDRSGYRLNVVGDINGDGYNDFIIGAVGHNNNTGRSYVVFGGLDIGNNGLLLLSNLNGTNGFKLDGENNGDESGSVGRVYGDINGDGYSDLIIGAIGFSGGSDQGRTYVVFGGPGVGGNGTLSLSQLNGSDGFKLDGENNGDRSGYSVSAAGDFNGDGYADLFITAYRHNDQTGRSYVIWGGSNVGKSGLLSLSDLDGVNGFALDGESVNDGANGISIANGGDINSDGVIDLLIGANQHNNATGRTYVVFGDIPPVLVNNRLSLSVGAAITLNSTFISAYDRNHNNNTLVFVPGAVEHGQFEAVGAPGIPLVNFTQQQVTSGSIQFVHDGTLVAPSYDITVRSDGIAWTGPLSAKVDFTGAPPSYFPAILPLASLNGQNGFKLDGENTNDISGWSVSAAGDINGDGYADLLIGAYQHASSTGRSYVLFGGPGVGSSGLVALSGLTGGNGFKLDGEATLDYSGWSVSGAGDINGDGFADLLIGAYYHANYTGRSYVVLGGLGVGSSGLVTLSGLNGTNGFKLDGEATGDNSGYSVSGAGDINGDGFADLLIGAHHYGASDVGRSYVVFGGLGAGASGLIALSGLNGSNGFKLDGEAAGYYSGYSVSAVADINGDGFADLLIGAYAHASDTGRSYVVLGGAGVGANGTLGLSSLTGVNGFKLDGENIYDYSGYSVSGAGDVNGDGVADLLIGAYSYLSYNRTGRSYVVFGGLGAGASGLIALSGLNGSNGFKLDGEAVYDHSGYSVSTAGDINGDGFADLLIGAPGYGTPSTGRSYVVLGGPGVGSSGLVALSGLNGSNGFKLDGEAQNDQSGSSVSAAGDINGDGVADLLIGAPYYSASDTGCSYVVFGDAPPVLVQNRLQLYRSQTILLKATFVSVYDPNHPNHSIVFFPTNVTHGYFESTHQPGIPLTNFTQPQLLNGTIQFVHDGSVFAPSYNITVRSDGIAWTGPHPANITFMPTMTTTTTSTPSTTIVTTATPSSTPTPSTVAPTATPTTVTTTTSSSTPIPSTSTATSTPTVTATPAPTVTPTSTPRAPIVLVNNQLTFNNGSQVILSPAQLQATEAGYDNNQLVFLISDVQNGYFTLTKKNTTRLTAFNQSQVMNGEVMFVHSGNSQSPSYAVMVTDGVQYTVPDYAEVQLSGAPVITQNHLTIQPGQSVILSPADINVMVTDGSSPQQVVFQAQDIQHLWITDTTNGRPVTNFTLADVQAGRIQVTQDGSSTAPHYTLAAVGENGLTSALRAVTARFNSNGVPAPVLAHNYLLITQGEQVGMSTQNIYATTNESQPIDGSALFYVTEVTHGGFSVESLPGFSVTFFSQNQLQSGQVLFTHDDSVLSPSYRLSVRAQGVESASLPAAVIFRPVNQPPKLLHALTDQSATIGKTFSYAIPPDTFVDPEGEALELSVGRFNSSLSLPPWLKFDGLNNRFTGIPTADDFIDINVTAKDPEGLSVTTDFVLKVTPAPSPQETGFSTWQKTIIAALISGSIGIGFVLVQICMKRAANKKLMQILGQGDTAYERDVVRPVMKEITQRIKITRFMNAVTNKELMAFKSAVRSLLSALERRQVDINFSEMKESKKDEVINEIGHQTYRWMKEKQRGCAKCCPGMHAFFKPQLTAEALQEGVEEIADNVVRALQKPAHRPQPSLSAGLSVSGSSVYQEHKRKFSRELPQVELDSPPSPSGKFAEAEVHGDLPLSQLS